MLIDVLSVWGAVAPANIVVVVFWTSASVAASAVRPFCNSLPFLAACVHIAEHSLGRASGVSSNNLSVDVTRKNRTVRPGREGRGRGRTD